MNLQQLIDHLLELRAERPYLGTSRMPVRVTYDDPLIGKVAMEVEKQHVVVNGNTVDIEVE